MAAEDIKEHQFKPGQSGNPNGRPKGRKNLSTMIRDALENPVDWKTLPLKDSKAFSERFPDKTAGEVLVLTAIASSMGGDGQAREWLRKGGYGDKVDITSDDKPIPILGVMNVPTNDSPTETGDAGQTDQGDSGGDISGQDDSNTDAPDSNSPDQE